MSDFIKNIVEEVLNRGKPIRTGTAYSSIDESKRTNKQNEKVSDDVFEGLRRPNYQREKMKQRLSAKGAGSVKRTHNPSVHQTKNTVARPIENHSFSQLKTMSLVHGNSSLQNGMKTKQTGRVIGKTRDGGYAWFFPNVSKEVANYFHRPPGDAAIGVVKVSTCLPSQLLFVNEMIRKHSDIRYFLNWDKDGDGPFVLELFDHNHERLESVLNDIYQKLNRRSLKQTEVYTEVSPGPWLSKQLGLSDSVGVVAIMEGVEFYTSIMLIENYLHKSSDVNVSFEVERNYLLLKGDQHVSNIITQIKREADQLNL